MASERNRILKLKDYLETLGITVNIGKNKARGNRGLFRVNGCSYRIDISKDQTEDESFKVMIHEFAHFLHYSYDKKLESLDFIFGIIDNELREELIELTVDSISKSSIVPLFERKALLSNDISSLKKNLQEKYPDFKLTSPLKKIEEALNKSNLKYLLKHDNVRVIEGFKEKSYRIDLVEQYISDPGIISYLRICSKRRALKRINSSISRLNKYYNSNTELLARAFELYFTDEYRFMQKAPILYERLRKKISQKDIPMLEGFIKALN